MRAASGKTTDRDFLQREFEALGVHQGMIVMVHSSLSAFGRVEGGAQTVVGALRRCVGESGTIVVPAYTGQVADPCPRSREFDDPEVTAARRGVPVFHDALPTAMGAIPNAVLADPDRLRSSHPQASVAALGAGAREITGHQPLAYALGTGSPFEKMYELGGHILLLGVGHNRNSFLHHAESLIPNHRKKLRRFPYLVERQRLWVEAVDVGDDNDTYFPRIGEEFGESGLIRSRTIGSARCLLMESVPFIDYAKVRLEELLAEAASR
ncbi:AAC(3) family N-acetyltransferase [Kitasatospora sp. GP82]|uniref:aminoglycoside N(3)-acetyltransferase n=1 Tax=Kitasatospora sp. GP82 TaxID=3035089 RepID=UPI00247586FA|nr:AAC(3) family N-acetyltransferase [Kitasatospora sp. GP82]MDH6123905.1 aminoglycoside 3-N-acetyltransferase [Kitasatospora sp. GP82]